MESARNKIRVTNRGIELEGLLYVIFRPAIQEIAHEIRKFNIPVNKAKDILTYYADSIEC